MTVSADEADAPAIEAERRTERRAQFECELRASSDGLDFEGYAAVFDQPYPVNDWRGNYTETVHKGAFKKTLSEQRSAPTFLFHHGLHPMIGRMPIAEFRGASEDSRGLHVKGRMFDNFLTRPVIDAMRGNAAVGLSYEFEAVREQWSPDRQLRALQEVKFTLLGHERRAEFSITPTPVCDGATLSLRSILALDEIIEADPEIRAALDAARKGTSDGAVSVPPSPADEHPVPEETMRLWARSINRRFNNG